MTDPSNDEIYERWIAQHRDVSTDPALIGNVMRQINRIENPRVETWWGLCFQKIEESWMARCVACGAAMAIGCIPFVLAVQVANL